MLQWCVCRARSGKGTGKAKKGGAGGKYTWEGAGGALMTGDDLEVLHGLAPMHHDVYLKSYGLLVFCASITTWLATYVRASAGLLPGASEPPSTSNLVLGGKKERARLQVDPNDPNYDPDEDEPRRAPVALHAGQSEEVTAFKQAVWLPPGLVIIGRAWFEDAL